MLIDLHSHTLLSDGSFTVAEQLRRAEIQGYDYFAITDHVDSSNLDIILPQIILGCKVFNKQGSKMKALAGVELTHIHPNEIKKLTKRARELGAQIVAVHGETIVEPVIEGTNRKAIEAKVDFLAHPGVIAEEDVILAAQNGVFLEISKRKGHALGNGRTAALARKHNAKLIFNSDSHSSFDFYTEDTYTKTALGAGLSYDEFMYALNAVAEFVSSKF